MKKLLLSFFSAAICTAAFADNPQIKLSEKIYQNLSFSYCDQYGDSYSIFLDKDQPKRSISSFQPVLLTDSKGYTYYILPGEELNLYGDSIQLSFSNYDRFIRQNELYFFKVYAQQLGDSNKTPFFQGTGKNFAKNMKPYLQKLREERDGALQYIEDYNTARPMSDSFKQFCTQYFNSVYATGMLQPINLLHKKLGYLNNKQRRVLETCLGYNVSNPAVQQFLHQYFAVTSRDNKEDPLKALNNKLPQENLDYILFSAIKNNILAERDNYTSYKEEDITNEQYKDYLEQLKKYQTNNYQDLLVQDISGKTTPLLKAIADSANKYYYICFWNANMMDAQKEMKEQIILKNKYIHAPVEIIFVSLEENPVVWKTNCKNMGIENAPFNYIAPHNTSSKIANVYKIKQLPHNIILDNNGYVLNLNALPITNKEMDRLLDKYQKVFGNERDIISIAGK